MDSLNPGFAMFHILQSFRGERIKMCETDKDKM